MTNDTRRADPSSRPAHEADNAVALQTEHERFLAEVVETADIPFGVGAPDGRLVTFNQAFAKLTGYSREELLQRQFTWATDLTPEEWRASENERLAEAVRTRQPVRYEKEYLRKNGTRVPVELFVKPAFDAAGNLLHYRCFLTDITERKRKEQAQLQQAEDALLLREHEFRSLAEAMPQIVWATRPDGWNIYFNRQWVDYTGMTMEESHGHGWNKPFHPVDQQRAWEAWQRATKNNEPYSLECRLRRADGVYRWWLVRGAPMLGANGEILKWFGTCTDIEEIKQSETALQEANERLENRVAERTAALLEREEQLRLFIEHAPASIAMFDLQMRYIATSQRWLVDFDLVGQDLHGRSHYDIFPEIPERWKEIHRRCLAGAVERADEDPFVRPDGSTQWIHWEVRPWHGGGGIGGIIIFSEDITARKQAEEAIRRNQQLLQAVIDNSQALIYVKDLEGRIIVANQALGGVVGLQPRDILGKTSREIIGDPEIGEAHMANDRRIIETGEAFSVEENTPGHTFLSVKFPLRGDDGRIFGTGGVSTDITTLKKNADELRKLNRTLQALSLSDRTFMHIENEAAYLDKICQIIVQKCGFSMAWIGYAEADEGQTIRPVSSAGFEDGYLQTLHVTWADNERGRGPTGTAIRTGRPCVCANMCTDPAFAPWREQALQRGYASSLVLPLLTDEPVSAGTNSTAIVGRKAFGAITIYAREPDAFTAEEVELLSALASDLAHGITLLRLRAANHRIEQERETAVKFLRLMNAAKTTADLVHAATGFFLERSGCEAVGIRLKDGDDYPYFEARGFPEEFVKMENSLCVRDACGKAVRDSAGYPIQACMCGNVIQDRFDPSKPFFTAQGCFWTNSTTELLAASTEADRQARTRNRCNGEGYESVALIPLRVGNESLGLIQINDRRKGQFTAEIVAGFERLADYLATALAKTRAEDALKRNARRDELLSDTASQLLATDNPQGLVESLCRKVMDFLDCGAFFNFLVDEKAGKLHLNACAGIPADEARKIEWLDYGVAVCGCAARDATRIVAEDIETTRDPRTDLVRTYGIQAYCCHPLMAEGKVIGTLSFGTRSRNHFSEADIYMMKSVADLVTTAMVRIVDEQALRESEERFRAVASHTPDHILMQDRDLRYQLIVNPQRGLTEADMLGKTDADFLAPEDARRLTEIKRRVIDIGQPVSVEAPLQNAAGETEFFEGSYVPKVDSTGKVSGIIGYFRNITERKRTEELLRFLGQCGVSNSGEGFFAELARYLAQTLAMDFVCIDRLEEDRLTAQTLAVFHNGKFEDNVSYALKDTPCGDVVGKQICCFPRNVRALFAKDTVLQDLQAESYLGTTLWNAKGHPIGLIALIGRQPLADTRQAESILQLVAVRAAGELERQQAEEALRRHTAELERFNRVMIGRELRMIELKKEVNELCTRLGEQNRHPLKFEEEGR